MTPQTSPSTADQHTVRLCEARDVPVLANMLSQIFETDAAYRYLCPNAATRRVGLRRFFAGNLEVHLPHRCTHVMVDSSERLLATVTLRPPAGIHISPVTMIRRGLLPFAINQGFGAVKRLLWLKETYDALEHAASQQKRHWYVHMMAVAPDLQGRGLGGSLFRSVLAQTKAQDPTAPIVLTTHKEANVTFYRRAGFEVIEQRTLTPPHDRSYAVWSMGSVAPDAQRG